LFLLSQIQALEKEKEEKSKLVTKYETEKEMLMRKAINLKNSSPSLMKINKRTSTGLKSPEVLTEEEDNYTNRLDARKIYNKKNIITDINSDIDNLSCKSEISDATSMSSSQTLNFASDSELSTTKNTARKAEQDRKKKYQEFVKIMLKVKFEKIHNTHKGQEISERDLFYECVERQKIEPSQWQAFIIDVLKDPKKCQEIMLNPKKKIRVSLK
jgi:hypothetical protein